MQNITKGLCDVIRHIMLGDLNPFVQTQTPVINKLIGKGITFAESHAKELVCTPSQYGLLTGSYAFRSDAAPAAYGVMGDYKKGHSRNR